MVSAELQRVFSSTGKRWTIKDGAVWMYNAAIERKETRGMHKRTDYKIKTLTIIIGL
jgi:succinate dehydrogenase/fumarate reductase flavoprotein subunit